MLVFIYAIMHAMRMFGERIIDRYGGGAVQARCGSRSVRYLEVKIHCKSTLGPRIVSAVRS